MGTPRYLPVCEFYDVRAKLYDMDNLSVYLQQKLIHSALHGIKRTQVLDLACGTCELAIWLAEKGCSVTAVDFSPGMLEQARQKVRERSLQDRVTLIEADISQWVTREKFDVIVISSALLHIEALSILQPLLIAASHQKTRLLVSMPYNAVFVKPGEPAHVQARLTKAYSTDVYRHTFETLSRGFEGSSFRLEEFQIGYFDKEDRKAKLSFREIPENLNGTAIAVLFTYSKHHSNARREGKELSSTQRRRT